MRAFGIRAAVVLCALAAGALDCEQQAHATGYPVIDIAGLGQAVVQVTDTIAQVATMKQQLDRLRRDTALLKPRAYGDVLTTLRRNQSNYRRVINQVTRLGNNLDRLESRYKKLFPSEEELAQASPRERTRIAAAMHQEVHQTALQAMKAQSSLREIEADSAAAARIVEGSGRNESQVAQLQMAVQLLSLMHGHLNRLLQVTATAGRVTATVAASSVTERRLRSSRQGPLLDGYKSKKDGSLKGYLRGDGIPEVRGSLGDKM